jgi:outer membrane protein insertion porin family
MFAFLLSLPVFAQQTQTPETSYEGQKVASVDISANPEMNADSFRPLLQQKAGEPYSQEKVDATVAALKNTKQFRNVSVQVTPKAGGLQVLFIVEPAYYIGIIHFPGATGAFAYTQLLQAVAIADEQPYVKSETDTARQNLLKFLLSRGYFEATVDPQTEVDEQHKIVNVTFRVDLHHKAKWGQINIRGVPETQANHLRKSLRSIFAIVKGANMKTGGTFSNSHLDAADSYIQRHLRKGNRLAPQVRVESTHFNPATNRADVTFEARPGPAIYVRVGGAHIWSWTLHSLVPVYEESPFDPELVDEGRVNIISYFQKKGFFDVRVDSHINQQPNQIDVSYEIDKGRKHKLASINYAGNHFFSDKALDKNIKIKKADFVLFSHGLISDQLLRDSSNAIVAMYKDAGFSDVKVQPRVQDIGLKVHATFDITEGQQDVTNALLIQGNAHESFKALAGAGLSISPGKPYSLVRVQHDRNQILALYLNNGFLNVDFRASANPLPDNPHRYDVTYQIDEGVQASVNDVVVLGRGQTHASVINHAVAIDTGHPISETAMLNSESNLYNLGIFDYADVSPRSPITDQMQEDVLVKLHESKRNTLDYGFGFEVTNRGGNIPIGAVALPGLPVIGLGNKFTTSERTFVGPRGDFRYQRLRMRGRDETFSIEGLVARLDQRATISYIGQHLFSTDWKFTLSGSGERTTENPIFGAELGNASFQLQRFLNAKHTTTLFIRYNFQRTLLFDIVIPNLVLPQDQSVRTSTVSASFVRDTRDNALNAHHGIFQTIDLGITPSAFGSQTNFVRLFLQNAVYWPLPHSLVWANSVRLGMIKPFSNAYVPLSERYFTGGDNSLRGFPVDGAGPQRSVPVCSNPSDPSTCTQINVPVGGDVLFIFNSEIRFPIPIKSNLGGVLFYDGGNAYGRINFNNFINNYTHSVGLGLRYETPVGPIRVDVGRTLNPIPGVNPTQYFITIGQAF